MHPTPQGYLSVQLPGSYRLRAVSSAGFLLALEGKWQLLERNGSSSSGTPAWDTSVTLLAPGGWGGAGSCGPGDWLPDAW